MPAVRRRVGAAVIVVVALVALLGCGSGSASGPSRPSATPATTAAGTPSGVAGRPSFQNGVAYPKWGTGVYGASDASWQGETLAVRQQTGAGWIEMIVSLDQDGDNSARVYAGTDTISPDALYAGIVTARQAGLKVFVEPLLNVRQAHDNWSGFVTFSTHTQAQAWFASYWSVYQPYVAAAKRAGASQVSIGAEFATLQRQYPDLWTALAHQVKTEFGGPVTYDINHSDLGQSLPGWMRSPDLSAIGVSMYLSPLQAPSSQDWSQAQIEQWWQATALPLLDRVSAQTGKPVVLTEIGYRNATDALYQPWVWQTTAAADPTLQAAAYAAAMRATAGDPHVEGLYFWGWGVGQYSPSVAAIAAMRAAWR